MSQLLRVEDRDRKGAIVPFNLKPAQDKIHRLIDRARALNVWRTYHTSADLATQGALERLGFKAKWSARAAVDALAPKIDAFMLAVEELALPVEDGPVKIVVLKCRRCGVSAYVQGRCYITTATTPNTSTFVMAHRGQNSVRVHKYSADFHRHWPPEHEAVRPKAISTQKQIGWEWDNGSRAVLSSSGSDGSARGDQFDIYHFSETAFYEDYDEVNAALMAKPSYAWVFEESTANGATGGFHTRFQQAMDLEAVIDAFDSRDADAIARWGDGYFRYFYSWLEEPEYRSPMLDFERDRMAKTLDVVERGLMKLGADLEQLKWRRNKLREISDGSEGRSGLAPEAYFEQEFPATPEEAFQASGSKWFDQKKLQRMLVDARGKIPAMAITLDAESEPAPTAPHLANLIVWSPPVPGHAYAIGADVAQGLKKGDWSVAVVVDRHDGTKVEEVALLRLKTTAPAFGDMLTLLGEWYNEAFLVPEVNGPGLSTCHRIVDNRYARIYHRESLDLVQARGSRSSDFRFGFSTTVTSKDRILADAQEAIRQGSMRIWSRVVIDELMSLETDERGRKRAVEGGHDDCVIAACLALYGNKRGPSVYALRKKKKAAAEAAALGIDRVSQEVWEVLLKKVRRETKRRRETQRAKQGLGNSGPS